MSDNARSMSTEAAPENTTAQTDEDLLKNLLNDLHILNCEHKITQIETSRLVFPSNVEDVEPTELTETEVIFLSKGFLHVGLVNKKTAVEPLKRNQVLLTTWPSNIASSAYKDGTYMGGTKEVRALIFSVPEEVYNKYHSGVTPHEVVAAAAIVAPVEDWKFFESKVMSAFFHMRFDSTTSFSEETLTKIWKELPTSSLDSVWRQMLFICCGPYDIGYHVKRMLTRNSVRIRRLMQNSEEQEISLEGETISEYNIISILAEWCRFSRTKIEQLLTTLKDINSIKPILSPKTITEKINMVYTSQVASAKKFRCDQCSYETNDYSNFGRHLRMHIGKRPFVCKICAATFNGSSDLAKHMNVHRAIPAFYCIICGRPFTRRTYLQYHLAGHQKMGTLNYECYACKKEFTNEEALKEHMPSHLNDLRHKCNICSKKFANRTDLREHKSVHDVKRHKCNQCEKTFNTKHSLKLHMRLHNPDKCFACDYCGKTFKLNTTRLNHIFSQHEKDQILNEREDLKRAAAQPKTADASFKMEVDK